MTDSGSEILGYMYRHKTENGVSQFSLLELPDTWGISYLAKEGYIVGKKFGTKHANITMTTKGIDWVKRNTTDTPTASPIFNTQEAKLMDCVVTLRIHTDIYDHVKSYLDSGHYFSAVEEAYKFVREKLLDLTGKEKASDVFNMNAENARYHEAIFGKTAEKGTAESNFFRGVGYLHLAIQFLRNEKTHTLATSVDKNLAIHYISLASLAYDLLSRGEQK